MIAETMQAEAEEPQRNTVEIDGVVIDADTGEVITDMTAIATSEPFAVRDEATLEWFLKRIQTIDARMAALTESPEVQAARALMASEEVRKAEAILNNHAEMYTRLSNARTGLLRWQDAPLRATAAAILAERHEKGRTLRTLFGAVSLKKIAARWCVADGVETKQSQQWGENREMEPILAWAVRNQPSAVKISTEFQISKLPKDADRPAEFFTLEPEREQVTVDTGVGIHTA